MNSLNFKNKWRESYSITMYLKGKDWKKLKLHGFCVFVF